MLPKTLTRYVDAISRTRKGLKVLIVDDFVIERQAFLEIVHHYLPESIANAMDRPKLKDELKRGQLVYDLIILEESLLLDKEDRRSVQKLRTTCSDATFALFANQKNLPELHRIPQISAIDILLTKSATVEGVAEKLCLAFQDTDRDDSKPAN